MDAFDSSLASIERHISGIERCLLRMSHRRSRSVVCCDSGLLQGGNAVGGTIVSSGVKGERSSGADCRVSLEAKDVFGKEREPRSEEGGRDVKRVHSWQSLQKHLRETRSAALEKTTKVQHGARPNIVAYMRHTRKIKRLNTCQSVAGATCVSSRSSSTGREERASVFELASTTSDGSQLLSTDTKSPSSSVLSAASALSFSSIENNTTAELATRWLQWRKESYGLLATHYERAYEALYYAEFNCKPWQRERMQNYQHTTQQKMYIHKPENDPKQKQKKEHVHNRVIENVIQANLTTTEKQRAGYYYGNTNKQTIQRTSKRTEQHLDFNTTNVIFAIVNKEVTTRCALEQEEDEAFTGILDAVRLAAERDAARDVAALEDLRHQIHHRQLLTVLEGREAASRCALEQEEDEAFTGILDAVRLAAERDAARDVAALEGLRHQIHHRQLLTVLEGREAASRCALEQEEDEAFTGILDAVRLAAERDAARDVAALEDLRHQIHHRQLLTVLEGREAASRCALEQEEDEAFTGILDAVRLAAERDAARDVAALEDLRHQIHHRQLLTVLEGREAASRCALEQEEDEAFTGILDAVRLAAERDAARDVAALEGLRHQIHHRQLLTVLEGREAASRCALEQEEDEAFTGILDAVRLAAERDAARDVAALEGLRHQIHHRQLLTVLEGREAASRCALEQEEDEAFTGILDAVRLAAERDAARDVAALEDLRHQIHHRQLLTVLEGREAASRCALEQEEDEAFTGILDAVRLAAERDAARDVAALEGLRHQIHHRQLLTVLEGREAASRCALEQEEDEAFTGILDAVRLAAERDAARDVAALEGLRHQIHHRQLLTVLEGREAASRCALEQEEDEAFTGILDAVRLAAERDAARDVAALEGLRHQIHHRQLLTVLEGREAASRCALEQEEDEAFTGILDAVRLAAERDTRSVSFPSKNFSLVFRPELTAYYESFSFSCKGRHPFSSFLVATSSTFIVERVYCCPLLPLRTSSFALSNASGAAGCFCPLTEGRTSADLVYTGKVGGNILDADYLCAEADIYKFLNFQDCGLELPLRLISSVARTEGAGSIFSPYFCKCFTLLVGHEAQLRLFIEHEELHERQNMRLDELNCYRIVMWHLPHLSMRVGMSTSPSQCAGNEVKKREICFGPSLDECPSHMVTSFCVDVTQPVAEKCQAVTVDAPLPHMLARGTNDDTEAAEGVNQQSCSLEMVFVPPTIMKVGETRPERKSGVMWCVDMTAGKCGVPPHMRNRPWAGMLSRKGFHGRHEEDSDVKAGRYRGSNQDMGGFHGNGRICREATRAELQKQLPVRRFSKAHEIIHSSRQNVAKCRRSRLNCGQSTVTIVNSRKRDFSVGYAQQYERRLFLQKHLHGNGYGACELHTTDPLYCRATISFLESAEWCYQKSYIHRYFSSLSTGGDGCKRKCADSICEAMRQV